MDAAVAALPVVEASPLVAGVSTGVSAPASGLFADANLVVVGFSTGTDVVPEVSAAVVVVDLVLL